MYIFKALKEDGINSSNIEATSINPDQFASGGIVESIKKHPKKIFFKFEGGRYNIDNSIVKEAVSKNEIVCTNFAQFISEIIGCSNIDAINVNTVIVSKHDNYFLLVFNFKSSNKDSYTIISNDAKHSISLVAKFIVVEDVSEDKSVEDINSLTGSVSGGTSFSDPITEIEIRQQQYIPQQLPIINSNPEPPVQNIPQPSIHEQAAAGGVDKWDSALNDTSYTGGPI